jgi:hypothetical protein
MKLSIFQNLINLKLERLADTSTQLFTRNGKEIKPAKPFHREARIAMYKRNHRRILNQIKRKNTKGLPLGISKRQAAKARVCRKKKNLSTLLPHEKQLVQNTVARLRECHNARRREK